MKKETKEELSLNQHIEDLKERMKMLQNDRKSNIDILESNKTSNKEEIKRLRDENKELRQKFATLQKTASHDEERDEQKHIAKEVDRMRRIYDELKLQSSRYHVSLEKLRDTVRDLDLNSQKPHLEDNEFTRTIRALENKLDKAMIKYNEAQSIRKTYESIVKRLREERVGFDNQLAAIERTLGAKQKDYEELLLLSGDANHAREIALNELERVRAGYEEERKRRERELRERHQVIQMRKQMLERIKQREKIRSQIESGELNNSYNKTMDNTLNSKLIATERIETRNKIDIFENAFRKIKEATGVSDVNEVIQKIISQESTTENLINLTKENQVKIEGLYEQKRKLKIRVEEAKYTGLGGGHKRKMVDDQEDQLSNCTARLERAKLKYERLNKIIISMKAGVGHLQDKLESVRDDVGGKRIDVADETVAEVLREGEITLTNVIRRIKAAEDDMRHAHMTSFGGDPAAASSAATAGGNKTKRVGENGGAATVGEESDINISRPFNQRIDLLLDELGLEQGGDGTDYLADANGEMDDDELTRDKVKRASTQILQQIDKRKRKAPKKKDEKGNNGGQQHSRREEKHIE